MDAEWFLFLSPGAKWAFITMLKVCEETMTSQKALGVCPAISAAVLAHKAGVSVDCANEIIGAAVSAGELVISGDRWVFTDLTAFASDRTIQKLEAEKKPIQEKNILPHNDAECRKTSQNAEKVVPYADADALAYGDTYKQEESTMLLPKGNEKALAMPELVQEPEASICKHLAEVARFRKRFCDPSHSQAEFAIISRIVEGYKGTSRELIDLAAECSSFYQSNKKHVSPGAVFRTWVKNHVTNFGRGAPIRKGDALGMAQEAYQLAGEIA
jgi:hypothetical protein